MPNDMSNYSTSKYSKYVNIYISNKSSCIYKTQNICMKDLYHPYPTVAVISLKHQKDLFVNQPGIVLFLLLCCSSVSNASIENCEMLQNWSNVREDYVFPARIETYQKSFQKYIFLLKFPENSKVSEELLEIYLFTQIPPQKELFC